MTTLKKPATPPVQTKETRTTVSKLTGVQPTMTVMCIGEAGTGKSTFAASFPKPMYVFNFDMRTAPYEEEVSNGEIVVGNFSPSVETWTLVEKEKLAVDKEVKEGKWKTVVIDSTTALQALALEKALQLDPKRDVDGGPLWNVHYTIRKNLTQGVIRKFLSWRGLTNLVLIVHYAPEVDSKGNIVGYQPDLGGSLSREIPTMFDEIYLHSYKPKAAGKADYFVRLVPYGLYKGVRSKFAPKLQQIEFPNNYTNLIEKFKEASNG